ncbi:hypothetical protein J2X86_003247 [Acinetobacter lwoffii]|uniref:Uncharacterized protein n=1 Tax=Acinetobacter lwoffii TaxID=28090 RepID=A0AAW8LH59_ACILW|nr:hypothetical protein [Acinetobacter lwoffii]
MEGIHLLYLEINKIFSLSCQPICNSAVLVLMLTVMWMIVAAKTLAGAYRGNLFVSPCIHSLSKASKT